MMLTACAQGKQVGEVSVVDDKPKMGVAVVKPEEQQQQQGGSAAANPSPAGVTDNMPADPNPLWEAPAQTGRASWTNSPAGQVEPIEPRAGGGGGFGADYAFMDNAGELDEYYAELRAPHTDPQTHAFGYPNVDAGDEDYEEDERSQLIYELPQIAIGGAASRRHAPDAAEDSDQLYAAALYTPAEQGFMNPIMDLDAAGPTLRRPTGPFGLGGFGSSRTQPYGARVATNLFTQQRPEDSSKSRRFG